MSDSLRPMDYSPPSSSVHGILQARILEWVSISSPGDLPDPGIEPRSPTLQADALTSVPPGKLSDEQIDINFINILKRTCMFYTFFYMEDTFK